MSRLVFVLGLLGLLVLAAPVAAVGVGSFVANVYACEPLSAEVSFLAVRSAPAGVTDSGTLALYDGDGTLVASQSFSLPAGTNAALIYQLIQWTATPQANPLRAVISDSAAGAIVWEQSFTTDCLTRTVTTPALTYSSSGIQISIAPEGDAFTLFGVGLDGTTGFAVVTLSAEELAALPETPEENTLIATGTEATYWGEVNVYQLTTGEIQVNVGPDAEGKVRVTIYDAIPPTRVYGYEFNVLSTP